MNQNRIARRAARIGATGQEYLLNVSKLRAMVRDYSRDRIAGYRINPANRPSAQDKVFQARKFWFGDQFSAPASPAARAALRVACNVGSDYLAFRAAVLPGYYRVLAENRHMERARAAAHYGELADLIDREGRN
ncbi:hypothetical protein ACXIUT_15210 [Achromobacter denitrificans]